MANPRKILIIKSGGAIVKKLKPWVSVAFNNIPSLPMETTFQKKVFKNFDPSSKTILVKYGSNWFKGIRQNVNRNTKIADPNVTYAWSTTNSRFGAP